MKRKYLNFMWWVLFIGVFYVIFITWQQPHVSDNGKLIMSFIFASMGMGQVVFRDIVLGCASDREEWK